MTIFKKIGILILMSLIFAACGGEENERAEAPDSDAASIIENATFTDLDGNVVDIKDFRGKLVLIDFWESWCGPCLQVFPSMQQLREEYPDEFEMLAVTVGLTEGPEDARQFAANNPNYDFTWLYDENSIFEKIGGQGIPFKAYVSPEGKLIDIEMGSRGRQGDYNTTKAKIQEYF